VSAVEDLRVTDRVTIPASEIRLRFSRSAGPGGQNVNRRATRVEAVLDLRATTALTAEQRRRAAARLAGRLDRRGRLRVVASAGRTQAANRRAALERLRALLAEALRPPPPARRPSRPTRAARERRLAAKRARSRVKRARRPPVADE
jgi:ribosome-associated protein